MCLLFLMLRHIGRRSYFCKSDMNRKIKLSPATNTSKMHIAHWTQYIYIIIKMGEASSPRNVACVEKMKFLWETLVCAVLHCFRLFRRKYKLQPQKLSGIYSYSPRIGSDCRLHSVDISYRSRAKKNKKKPIWWLPAPFGRSLLSFSFYFLVACDMIFIGQLMHFNLIKRSVHFLY